MSDSVIQQYQVLYSTEKIAARIETLGQEISTWARGAEARSGDQVLAVCILRGAIYFFSDVLRQLSVSVEPTFCRTWNYSPKAAQNAHRGVRINVDNVFAQGRAILMVDDICDSGMTLAKLQNVFLDLGAIEVRSVVLIQRISEVPHFKPDWSGFELHGKNWLVGYGMDDNNRNSNLATISLIDGVEK